MSDVIDKVQWRFRLVTCCIALVAIAFIQSPGRIVADTKLDLAIDPGGFLQRAMNLWDPNGSFGQVQNQAYGYLFPMGPFFWAGDLLQLDAWVVQRLWWSLLFVVAFLGMVKLANELGVRSPFSRIVAGFAFALSPRILSVIGPSSIEAWPAAVAPWVLVPLVIGMKHGNPIKMAALSALAVTCVGGVNAAATFAVIPLGALWLMLAQPGRRRRKLMTWWPVFVAMGTLWWLVPLFLLGSYSPPFLDYIESASVTTVAATAFDALRGTTNWVPYISSNSVAGNALISQPMLIVNGFVVMALGLIGLSMPSTPHRKFLFGGLLLGLIVVTAGHVGPVQGIESVTVQHLLDGVLAPLRNTHKFDVLIRIPMVIGLAFTLSALATWARRESAEVSGTLLVGVSVLAVAGVIGAAVPAWTGQLANKGSFTEIPRYWTQASAWLANNTQATSLLAPASAFPEYGWGRTGDEPFQPLARSPWAVRNSIPLANGGNIRFLDSVNARLSQARGSAGLASTLRRAGVGYVVVRNDLDPVEVASNTESAYRTIEDSEGLTKVASFGPEVGGEPNIDLGDVRSFSRGGWQAPHRAIEIFEVERASANFAQSVAATPTVVGDPESLAMLDELGLTEDRSVFLAADQPRDIEPTSLIMTDGNRQQEVAFGSVHRNRSSSLGPKDDYSANRPVHDYAFSNTDRWTAVPKLEGADSLTASSSRAEASAPGGVRPADLPWSAFDGDERTAWTASDANGWIRLGFDRERNLGQITVRSDRAPGERQELSVTTENGPVSVVTEGTEPEVVTVGSVLNLTIRGTSSTSSPLSIAEISSPSLSLSRPLVLPTMPNRWPSPSAIVLGSDDGDLPGCIMVKSIDRCRADTGGLGEDGVLIDRLIAVPDASYRLRLAVEPIGGSGFDATVQNGESTEVSASSTINLDPRASVTRVVDRDTKTGWISRPGDTDPTLTMRWDSPQRFDEIHLATAGSLPASEPTMAVLEFDDGDQRSVRFVGGMARFPSVTSESVSVHLEAASPAASFDLLGIRNELPIGVSELWFGPEGKHSLDFTDEEREFPCGAGPTVTVDGVEHETSVKMSGEEFVDGRIAEADICNGGVVALGVSRIRIAASELFRPASAVFERPSDAISVGASPVDRVDVSKTERRFRDAGGVGAQLLQTNENFNEGWMARAEGRALEAVQVNGWQQAWRTPVGTTGPVTLEYRPNIVYQVGMLTGALSALTLFFLALRRWKPWADELTTQTRRPKYLVLLLCVAALLIIGGVGFLAAAACGALATIASAKYVKFHEWFVSVPIGAAAVHYAIRPWGSDATWAGFSSFPQICVAISLGIVAVMALSDRHDLSFMKGNSTKR